MTAPSELLLDEPAEFETGRTFPFATVGDWVALSGVSDRACRVYWLLRMHVNRKRERRSGDSVVWPTQLTIASIIGVKKTDTIAAAVKELVALQAVEVTVIKTPTGRRNRYTVHLAPPRKYAGFTSMEDYYDAREAEVQAPALVAPKPPKNTRSEGVTQNSGVPPETPENGGGVTQNPGVPIPPKNGAEPQEVKPQEGNQGGYVVGDRHLAAEPPSNTPTPSKPMPGRPDTWKCDRHLANPDPEDRPCGPCRAVRERCQARQAELDREAELTARSRHAEEVLAARERREAELKRAAESIGGSGHQKFREALAEIAAKPKTLKSGGRPPRVRRRVAPADVPEQRAEPVAAGTGGCAP